MKRSWLRGGDGGVGELYAAWWAGSMRWVARVVCRGSAPVAPRGTLPWLREIPALSSYAGCGSKTISGTAPGFSGMTRSPALITGSRRSVALLKRRWASWTRSPVRSPHDQKNHGREIGTEMERFPSADHLASWAGVAPGDHEGVGKRAPDKTRKSKRFLRTTLVQAAHGAARAKHI
jgi:hypothetical protein